VHLESIKFKTTRVCLAEPGKIIVVGEPSIPLDYVLPYLANLPGVLGYKPDIPALTFRRKPGFMTIYSNEVVFTQVLDTETGQQLFEALVEAINTTWASRDHLQPVTETRKPTRHLDLYELLPKTNCAQCGELTCLAFASKLFMREVEPSACLPLFEDVGYKDKREILLALMLGGGRGEARILML
jgi:ArsR family metal-binding transcriptional regulator